MMPTIYLASKINWRLQNKFLPPSKNTSQNNTALNLFKTTVLEHQIRINCRRKKHYRGHFPYGVFFQVVLPVFSSPIPAPCRHKIPVLLGSFAFCRENNGRWEKEDAGFFTSFRKWRTQRRKIEDYLIQWIGIASLVDVGQDIINFLSPPWTWMYPVVKSIV